MMTVKAKGKSEQKTRWSGLKIFRKTAAMILTAVLALSCLTQGAGAAGTVQVEMDAEFKYSEARSMLKLINNFRTGDDAWYLSSNNRTRVRVKGLKALEYDYNLENTAMLRALGQSVPSDGFAALDSLAAVSGQRVPAPLAGLREKPERFTGVLPPAAMADAVEHWLTE